MHTCRRSDSLRERSDELGEAERLRNERTSAHDRSCPIVKQLLFTTASRSAKDRLEERLFLNRSGGRYSKIRMQLYCDDAGQ